MEHLQPLLVEYKTWLLDQYREVTPKSNIGRAIKYALNRHEGMENMLIDGRLKLDNNRKRPSHPRLPLLQVKTSR